jgi:glycosyltransferase involved in cell wall biosynthesis
MQQRDLLLDVTRLVWRVWSGRLPTGIDRVCLAYLEHYGPRALAVVQRQEMRLVLSAKHSAELFALLRTGGPGFRRRLTALLAAAALSRGPRQSTRGWTYLNIGHTGLDAPGLARWLAQQEWKPVYLVHDLVPISHPEFCRPGESKRHRQRMRTVLDSAAGVIANSAATRDALGDFASREGRQAPPCQVAWLASPDEVEAAPVPEQNRPTFVMIGTIEGRKNHLLLLHLWEKLTKELGPATPKLVLIGQRGWEADEVFALLDRSPRLEGYVRELGRCDDATMFGWLDQARALLMPSFIEGFGIPVIEALQRGVPVIASDLPVFREIAGDIPLYLDPLDGQAWEAAIRAYCGDTPDRERQLAAMAAFRAPTWDDHFTKVDGWLARL